jgi:hypothetical protein
VPAVSQTVRVVHAQSATAARDPDPKPDTGVHLQRVAAGWSEALPRARQIGKRGNANRREQRRVEPARCLHIQHQKLPPEDGRRDGAVAQERMCSKKRRPTVSIACARPE